ncbi:MAG: hypothetical protein PHQ74_13685 [Crocinitomicaceae bacterium]|nr:hypothetical protein [Crocinitomicaceae bacterium]
MKENFILSVFSILFGLSMGSCKKEIPILEEPLLVAPESTDCPPLKIDTGYLLGDPYLYNDYAAPFQYGAVVNPNNDNEIIFYEGIAPNTRLYYYNLATHEKRMLLDESVLVSISWSKKDWILFQKSADFNLYKMKSNGDSLTQLSFGQEWYEAQWNHAGDKYIAYYKNGHWPRTFILNEDGLVIDSLANWQHQSGSWSHPNYYLGFRMNEIMIMEIETKTVIKHLNLEKNVNFINWGSINEIIYTQGNKTYNYNLLTNETKLIKFECYVGYQATSFSSDFNKLFFMKGVTSLQANGKYLHVGNIITMNKDGSNEQQINP